MPGSPDPHGALDRATLRKLFDELAEELAHVRTRAHVYIVGGAAMTMAYQRDRATHDVDAKIEDGVGIAVIWPFGHIMKGCSVSAKL